MKYVLLLACLIMATGCQQSVTNNTDLPVSDVLQLAQTSQDSYYQQAIDSGAEIIPVDENESFAVWWAPENFDPAEDPVIVSLHGHGGWATKDFTVWQSTLQERGYAYLGLQWWFGRSLDNSGYYEPDIIYDLIREQLIALGIQPGRVILQGFSMGSARSYAITEADQLSEEPYFAVTIANAGPYVDNYPPNTNINHLADTHWILYCGVLDVEAKYGCSQMGYTKTWLESEGAIVDLFIEDATGGHGGFMINRSNAEAALDVAITELR